MRRLLNASILCLVAIAALPAAGAAAQATTAGAAEPPPAYGDRADVRAFVDRMADRHGFDRAQLQALLADARYQQTIIERISRPAERTLTWAQYRRIFLGSDRIEQGTAFWGEHADTIARAAARFGVAPEYLVAILGVETRYGRLRGDWRVLDALATLAFDYPPRGEFFGRELEEYLLLTREEGLDPRALTGSYAGAMGYGQFISSSYRAYAVDFDGDGVRDIRDDPEDAIGSVANYFARHGWRTGGEVARRVSVVDGGDHADGLAALENRGLKPSLDVEALTAAGVRGLDGLASDADATLWRLEGPEGEERVVGLHNFYVITRYNHSHLYALAVHDLAMAIAAARSEALARGD
ncbi:MAG TPA: lytic murein transglycosylase B [Pseudomonadales bacterium]|nr:lytic murein transglycosylase B [Pseudomonadales bacterium]